MKKYLIYYVLMTIVTVLYIGWFQGNFNAKNWTEGGQISFIMLQSLIVIALFVIKAETDIRNRTKNL